MVALQPLLLADYVNAPRLSVSSAVSLGIALLTVVPKPAPQAVRVAATRLRVAVVELQREWNRELDAGSSDTLPRDADLRVDRAIRSTSMRLEAYALLSPEHVSEATRAKAAQGRLFPQGLRFLNLPYEEQWAHGQRLLESIDKDEQLAADIEELVGETIFSELRAAQKAYGAALGITAERTTPQAIPLLDRLSAVRNAIVSFALQVVAMQDADSSRIPDARKALGPIDELRARQSRRVPTPVRGNGTGNVGVPEPEVEEDTTVTPTTPVPTVEGAVDDLAATGT